MHKKVIILTSNNPFEKSGRTSIDLKRSLFLNGIDSVIIADKYFKSNDDKIISTYSFFRHFIEKLLRIFKKKIKLNTTKTDKNYYMFSYNSHNRDYNINRIIKKLPFIPDVIIYVFCRDFLNEKHLFKLAQKTNSLIIRFMADNHELSGGCHFFWDCKGYQNNCGSCPGLFSTNPKDITNENFLFKEKYINKMNTIAVGGSQWQYEKLKKSALYKNKNYYKILNPTDSDFFKPTSSRSEIINKFNLPRQNNLKFILFGAIDNREKRKGSKELFLTLQELKNRNIKNIHLLVIGNNLNQKIANLGLDYTNLGYVSFKNLVLSYQIADVYISPSIEDAGPTMINQSLMCGTPVCSFDIGVSSDLILEGETGYTADLRNFISLANGIEKIINLKSQEAKIMSKKCRQLALEKCSLKVVGKQFKECIESNL